MGYMEKLRMAAAGYPVDWRPNTYLAIKAWRIATRRSRELAEITGLPWRTIRGEIISSRMTPGEWAGEHGLDPITFRPLR